MTTQTRERAQAQANGSAVALASPDRPASRRAPAGDVIMAYLATQAARLKALDALLRRNAPDSVHQMRVAARRLRSTLQAYPEILPRPATQHLRDDGA
jgi:inorganic triphosphatase YgiF